MDAVVLGTINDVVNSKGREFEQMMQQLTKDFTDGGFSQVNPPTCKSFSGYGGQLIRVGMFAVYDQVHRCGYDCC